MKTKYFKKIIDGQLTRIYYYPELSKPTQKAVILTRWAKFKVPIISTGNRSRDKTLIRQWLADNGMTWDDLPANCEIHHNAFGDCMEWIPRHIHRQIKHRGGIANVSQANA